MAKGARKPKSKFGSRLISFSLSEIIYSFKPTREIQILQDISILSTFKQLRSMPTFFPAFSIFAEILLKTIQENEDVHQFFQHIVNVLTWLEKKPEFLSNGLINLLVAIPTQLGFRLNLNKCSICYQTDKGRTGFLNLEYGTWICQSCSKNDPYQKIKLSPHLRTNILACVPVKNLYRTTASASPQILVELTELMIAYLGFHLHKTFQLQSIGVFKELFC